MSIKQILDYLLNKKWDDLFGYFCDCYSKYVYNTIIRRSNWDCSLFLLFNISDETKEEAKSMI